MPPSEPACAYAKIALKSHSADVQALLVRIPGVRFKKGMYIVPFHALEPFDVILQGHGVQLQSAVWASPQPNTIAWEDVKGILEKGGEVRQEFLDEGYLMAYQKEALCIGAGRRGVHFWHPTGAGKTCSAILWSLLVPGPVIVVTRAAARFQYAREWEKYTMCRPFIIRPASTMKKKSETLEQYLLSDEKRHVVVAAWESLQLYTDKLVNMRPSAVIWDEAHLGKSSKRWESIPLPELPEDAREALKLALDQDAEARSRNGFISDNDGNRVMILPLDNTATAAARLARAAWRRCATTATPVKDRVRDLWAQLDIVEPDAWGSATCWLDRYADRKPGTYGGYDTTGTSNLEELTGRLAKVTHHIAYTTTHRQLPPKRRQSVYVGAEDQIPPSAGFANELKKAQLRGATAVLEVKLAEAASRKRKAVLGIIEDHVYAGGKVVMFTGRRKDVDVLGELIRKSDAVKAKSAGVWAAHGENSSEERSNIVLEYMAHPGPCVLVGTGDSFGESLNMQDTDAALFVMLPYTPGQIRQWEGRFCVAAGQLIPTLDGVKPVESVAVGDYVLTHAGRWQPVTATASRNLKTFEGGRRSALTSLDILGTPHPLRVTADHKVLVSIDKAEPVWVEAGRVTVGDELVTPKMGGLAGGSVQVEFPSRLRCREGQKKSLRYPSMPSWVTIDEEVAWLFGHFAGDGWTSASTTHYVGIASNLNAVSTDLARAGSVFQKWGVTPLIKSASRGKGANLYAYSKELATWFRELFGVDSASKRVPPMVYTWPKNLVAAFVQGYLDADGHLRPGSSAYDWTTVSPHLAFGMQLLLDSCGYATTTAKSTKGQYAGAANVESNIRQDARYVYRKVKSATTCGGGGDLRGAKVYDLTVPGDESFVVEGVAVHNCRLGQKRPVTIYYVIAEGSVDEHVADILIRKLPAVEQVAKDEELAAAKDVIAGFDSQQSPDAFADKILAKIAKAAAQTESDDELDSEEDWE